MNRNFNEERNNQHINFFANRNNSGQQQMSKKGHNLSGHTNPNAIKFMQFGSEPTGQFANDGRCDVYNIHHQPYEKPGNSLDTLYNKELTMWAAHTSRN